MLLAAHICAKVEIVKKRDLEKRLRELGFWLDGGGKHDKWTDGIYTIPVPRHREINEFTAKGILNQAEKIANLRGK